MNFIQKGLVELGEFLGKENDNKESLINTVERDKTCTTHETCQTSKSRLKSRKKIAYPKPMKKH